MAASRLLIVLLGLFALSHVSLEAADICEILDANYCFYFSDSSCYINLCQCDACARPDKAETLLDESLSNSTQERLCPTWCPHLKSNETIRNILEAPLNSTSQLPEISFECDDLKENCLAKKGYNGHCYFYEKNCETLPEISKKGKSKNSRIPKSAEECLKHQKKCSQKYKRHYSCKTFRKYCKKFNLTDIELNNNNSTIVASNQTQVSPLEQCLNFQKICAAKYRKHFACRQYRKKCKPFNLPEIHFESESVVTQKTSHRQHNKKMRKGHGLEHRKAHNETVVLSDELAIGNETLVETISRI